MKNTLTLEDLALRIRRSPCVALVGAGASIDPPTRAPDWVSFTNALVGVLAGRAASSSPAILSSFREGSVEPRVDPETVIQVLREELCLPSDRFFRFVHALEGLELNGNHLALASLAKAGRIKHVITTNLDDCIERALDVQRVPHTVHRESEGAAELLFTLTRGRLDERVHVLKIHGTVSDFDTVLVTKNDVALPLSEFTTRAVEGLLRRFPVLVFGYSGRDRDVMPILIGVRNESPGAHWCIYDESSRSPLSDLFVEGMAGRGGYTPAPRGFLQRLARHVAAEGTDPGPEARVERSADLRGWSDRLATWAEGAAPGDACLAVARVLIESAPRSEERGVVLRLLKAAATTPMESRLGQGSLSVRAQLLRARLDLFAPRSGDNDDDGQLVYSAVAHGVLRGALRELHDPGRIIGSSEAYSRLGEVARRVAWPTRERLTADVLVLMGRATEPIDVGIAQGWYEQALDVLIRADHVVGRNQALLGLARCERKRGALDASGSALARALFHAFAEGDAQCIFDSLLETAEFCAMCLESTISDAGAALGLHTPSSAAVVATAALQAAENYSRGSDNERLLRSTRGRLTEQLRKLSLENPAPRPFLDLLVGLGWEPDLGLRRAATMMRFQIAHLKGEFEDARRELEMGFRAAQLTGDVAAQMQWKIMRAEHYLSNERPFEALLILEEVLPNLEGAPGLEMLLRNLATACRGVGDLEGSRRYLDRAAELIKKSRDSASGSVRRDPFHEGEQFLAEKRYPEALAAFQQAAANAEEASGEGLELAHALHQVGLVHQRLSQLEEAESHYLRSLAIQRTLPKIFQGAKGPTNNPSLLAATLGSLGAVYLRQKDYERAMEFLVESYHRFDAMKSPNRRVIEFHFGEVEKAVGADRSRELYEKERRRLLKSPRARRVSPKSA